MAILRLSGYFNKRKQVHIPEKGVHKHQFKTLITKILHHYLIRLDLLTLHNASIHNLDVIIDFLLNYEDTETVKYV